MRVYHMSEQPYAPAWDHHKGSLRVNLPNRLCEPEVASALLHRYYDDWVLADELGLDIFINEHHQSSTCMGSVGAIPMAVMARETKRARLLMLGAPIGNRPDPLRVTEEYATLDVLSKGRLNMGFVKGVPYEVPVSNMNPVRIMDRFWEAHDFILKAMTSHDEPFNWEGEFFHYRHVNVWPRPWQQPHPPVWITTSSPGNAREIARRGHVMATMGTGYATKGVNDAYKAAWTETHGGEAPIDRFAYLGLVSVADTEKKARERAEFIASYPRTSGIVHVPFRNPPGFLPVEANARMLKNAGKPPPRTFTKDGRAVNQVTGSVQDLIDSGLLFCGTPDQVVQQITEFSDHIGGFGSLLAMAQAGHLSKEETHDNMTLLAKEVMPKLVAYTAARSPVLAQAAE
jgi:alkanesulfonate monooxygenase SsuD/methylene tetrahydromethanopterin reductase-like flavin-dependent oxidoreductase (luciferase family)